MKLGLIGSGMIVNELFTFIRDAEGIELTAIGSTERSYEKVKAIAQREGIPYAYKNADECILSPYIDTVYLGIPNSLHYEYGMKALRAGKNLIVEKPFTLTLKDAEDLFACAEENNVLLFEAIPLYYHTTFDKIAEILPSLGDIKLVILNYSQFSSRYSDFKKGIIRPNMSPTLGGGALTDLSVYNIHICVGLFGEPEEVQYYPNIDQNIDTSGVAVLRYNGFTATLIASKDSDAPGFINTIQGNKGCLRFHAPNHALNEFTYEIYKETSGSYERKKTHRMLPEFIAFEKALRENDRDLYEKRKVQTLKVVKTLERLRNSVTK
ncbi:MAG: Gfo/Idh/MocA family oxidoreductase [Erysipelotrichales bacterium]|nr:Gfo/Idh/MocA family oxidoreductase [Erysipelotrichales bacterium]MBQ4374229.1 Gfo/Idh/MocA family oxidoreductase [Erysipelotrichales bacterium]